MKIHGIDGMSNAEINEELNNGAKFVIYQYCISVILLTFKRPTDIYFIRPGKNSVMKGIEWSLLTLVLGWWGIPWGPIYTVSSLTINLKGGKDVTEQIRKSMDIHDLITPVAATA
jgi:hypothetical protein